MNMIPPIRLNFRWTTYRTFKSIVKQTYPCVSQPSFVRGLRHLHVSYPSWSRPPLFSINRAKFTITEAEAPPAAVEIETSTQNDVVGDSVNMAQHRAPLFSLDRPQFIIKEVEEVIDSAKVETTTRDVVDTDSVLLPQDRAPLFCINRPEFIIKEVEELIDSVEVETTTQDDAAKDFANMFHSSEDVQQLHPEGYPTGVHDSTEFETADADEDAEEDYDGDYTEEDIKHGILEAALELVPTHGWSKSAIILAAESYGYPGMAHGMFPGGAADLANYFYAKCNAELRAQLDAEAGREIVSQTGFVREALIRRLEMTLEVKASWSEAMGVLMTPEGISGALKNLTELSDDIWYYAGDRSTDTNWYTKRALLAAVYKSTEFYMLQDSSPDHQDTWEFLDRRLMGAVKTGTAFRHQRASLESVVGSIFGALTTASNIMGLNKK